MSAKYIAYTEPLRVIFAVWKHSGTNDVPIEKADAARSGFVFSFQI